MVSGDKWEPGYSKTDIQVVRALKRSNFVEKLVKT